MRKNVAEVAADRGRKLFEPDWKCPSDSRQLRHFFCVTGRKTERRLLVTRRHRHGPNRFHLNAQREFIPQHVEQIPLCSAVMQRNTKGCELFLSFRLCVRTRQEVTSLINQKNEANLQE